MGAACARTLAARGAHVTVADLDDVAAKTTRRRNRRHRMARRSPRHDQLTELRLETDILVNNAGIQTISPSRNSARGLPAYPEADVRGTVPAPSAPRCRTCMPRDSGASSTSHPSTDSAPSAFKAAYVTAKHGLEGLSKVTALEGGPHGVTSNCVTPDTCTPLVQKQIADQAQVHGISESDVIEKVMLTESAIKRLVEPSEVAFPGRVDRVRRRRHGDRRVLHDRRRLDGPMT
ncbi:SDR family oxidoreductase [Rhodococcus opacus]|nr:SDR family oxidoreductase [Rhodococcus opacus]